jgi:nucleotide sugar dehydrogenase
VSEASRVCVVGLGKIGLPVAVQYASKGLSVVGCDVDAGLVRQVNEGITPWPGEEGLPEGLAAARGTGRLEAITDVASGVRGCETVVVIVPVGLSERRRPDFAALDEAAASMARGLHGGVLVVLETTVPVGTTRSRFARALEVSGLRAGADFRLAYSPERVSVGRVLADLKAYPKVVGGINEESTWAAAQFYLEALDAEVLAVRDAETAEFVKLAETSYRDVNIALANELAQQADRWQIDVEEAIAAANSQPFSRIHRPGVGVGGHCIPVYPYFLADESAASRLATAAREVNDAMARYGVERLAGALGTLKGKTVLILGLAYRANVKEAANSSAFAVAHELALRGAEVLVHDPLFSAEEIEGLGLRPAGAIPPPHVDALVLQAAHDEYRKLDLQAFSGCVALLDGRNALSAEEVEAAGVRYVGIGR